MDIIEGLRYDIKHLEKAVGNLANAIELLKDVDGITDEEYKTLCGFAERLDNLIIDKSVELERRKEE